MFKHRERPEAPLILAPILTGALTVQHVITLPKMKCIKKNVKSKSCLVCGTDKSRLMAGECGGRPVKKASAADTTAGLFTTLRN